MSRVLNRQSLEDILEGATALGSGGGGSVQSAKSFLNSMVQRNSFPNLVSLEELPDSAHVAVLSAVGSCAVLMENFLDFQMVKALETYKKLTKAVDAVVSLETSQYNFLLIPYTAARFGVPVLDADGTGHSVPEFCDTVLYSSKVDTRPWVMCDSIGNEVLLNAVNLDEVDRFTRTIDAEMGGINGFAAIDLSGKLAKQILVPETFSRCERIGRAIRANRKGHLLNALLEATNGYLVIRGYIQNIKSVVAHGHDYGELTIKGLGHDKKAFATIVFKNEGLITYKNNQPKVISPDHIFMLDLFTHRFVTFTDATEGLPVALVAVAAHPKRRTDADLEGFRRTLHTVGYDGEYIPVEESLGGN